MCVRKQMILAVFVIAVTFGAISEFQVRIVQFCPSADRTFVPGSVCIYIVRPFCLLDFFMIFPLPFHLLRRIRLHISGTEEKYREIQD